MNGSASNDRSLLLLVVLSLLGRRRDCRRGDARRRVRTGGNHVFFEAFVIKSARTRRRINYYRVTIVCDYKRR